MAVKAFLLERNNLAGKRVQPGGGQRFAGDEVGLGSRKFRQIYHVNSLQRGRGREQLIEGSGCD